jgi:DOPA 4,5-dioxygenase
MRDVNTIQGWHAHVYFSPDQIDQARAVCEAAQERFDIEMGRMHPDPVGPHPTGSCQLTVPPEKFSEVTAWLTLNRAGLDVFTHAETGDVWTDHTQHVVWLGQSHDLRLDVLKKFVE